MGNASKRYAVIISEGATQMLLLHARFLAQVSESAALRLVSEFQEKTKSLEVLPQRNPLLTDSHIPAGKYHKLVFEKRYLLIYQIKGDTVFVDAVVDARQDYGWLLQ